MKPVTEYRLEWDTMPVQTTAGEVIATQQMRVSIFDNDNLIPDDQITNVIPLIPSATDSPLIISIIDNDEDKYTPIRGKQATIKFLSDSSLFQEMATFSDSSDNRWYVEIKDITNTLTIFVGFLMLPDMQQLFQPDPVVVELTASDHLGILKDIPLTDFNEDVPIGKYTMAALISYCLRKTGLSLYWTAINNLRHGGGERIATNVNFNATGNVITVDFFIGFFYVGMPLQIDSASNDMNTIVTEIVSSTQIRVADTLVNETATIYNVTFTDLSSADHFYELYNDTKTYEDEIGTLINCYEVLEKILGEDCFLTQHLGKWWIVRIDEYDSNLMYPGEFDPDGTFIEFGDPIDVSLSIGDADLLRFCNADQLLRSGRPHDWIKETFRYEYPIETVCNIDFDRGTGAGPVGSPSETVEQELDCWEFLREGATPAGLDTAPFAGSYGVLRKLYEFGYEKSRYIAEVTAGGFRHYFKSAGISLEQGDKIELGYDFRLSTSETMTNMFTAHVRLIGDDGFVYDWDYDEPTGISFWNQKTTSDPIFDNMFRTDWAGATTTDWHSISAVSEPLPVSGDVYIRLVNGSVTIELQFSNLTLDVVPFINGSYQKYTGHYNKVERSAIGYHATRDNQVYLGDSPRKLIKGGMFILVDGIYQLTTQFYVAVPGDSRPPNRYGYFQAFSVWNQYRLAYRIISGSVLGLGINPPDVIHKYILSDSNLNTTAKFFILISYNQNWKTGIWTGVFLEVFDSNVGKIYNNQHEFKYISK